MTSGRIFDIKRYAINDGPGIRTTVFFKGCPLYCRWCHNPEGISGNPEIIFRNTRCIGCEECITVCNNNALSRMNGSVHISREKCKVCGDCADVCSGSALEMAGVEISVPEVMARIEKDVLFFDESGGGVTFSGGEPLFQPEFLFELLNSCSDKGIHTAVDTSGYCDYSELERIMRFTDLFLFDLKTIDDAVHREYTGVSNRVILENLEKMAAENCNINIRIPLIPGINDTINQVLDIAAYIQRLDSVKDVGLLPYHNWGVEKFSRMDNVDFIISDFGEQSNTVESAAAELKSMGFNVTIGG